MSRALVWFRNDLRTDDHPALFEACRDYDEVIPLYIYEEGLGSASKWWLSRSLKALENELPSLIIRKGDPLQIIPALMKEEGVDRLFFNRHYEPLQRKQDLELIKKVPTSHFMGSVLVEPTEILTASGTPYQVFTPYWKRLQLFDATPLCRKAKMKRGPKICATLPIEEEVGSYNEAVGSNGALKKLEAFNAKDYAETRDFVALDGVSRLSPHLHFGEISPRVVYKECQSSEAFIRQVAWRDFAIYLLYHFPYTVSEPLYPKWKNFAWKRDPKLLQLWKEGKTGYPLVDAGMRQLQETGWIHNRARLVVASFLVKDLLIHWQEGANWFFEKLLDADLANNTLGWQWVAGCGADAAPFFRIFNPTTQAKKFDPEGAYIRRYVKELKDVPTKLIHTPYNPIIDHDEARAHALDVYRSLG